MKLKKYAIIVAGGKGLRMGNDIPKQFLKLHGKPILMHSIERFYHYDNALTIIVVLPSTQFDFWDDLCAKYHFDIEHVMVAGGDERFFSVRNGLEFIEDDNAVVAIHDGVRPLVSTDTLKRCFDNAIEKGNAVPTVNVVDSVRLLIESGNDVIDRNALRLIQTPQTFSVKLLKKAYAQDWKAEFTDDATVFESLGQTINLVEGNKENIKITSPIDMKIAEAMIVG